jgi:hypothetical protein
MRTDRSARHRPGDLLRDAHHVSIRGMDEDLAPGAIVGRFVVDQRSTRRQVLAQLRWVPVFGFPIALLSFLDSGSLLAATISGLVPVIVAVVIAVLFAGLLGRKARGQVTVRASGAEVQLVLDGGSVSLRLPALQSVKRAGEMRILRAGGGLLVSFPMAAFEEPDRQRVEDLISFHTPVKRRGRKTHQRGVV